MGKSMRERKAKSRFRRWSSGQRKRKHGIPVERHNERCIDWGMGRVILYIVRRWVGGMFISCRFGRIITRISAARNLLDILEGGNLNSAIRDD